jgi:type IV secretory pathway TrbL component
MWLDAPFFSVLDKLAGLQSYFIGQAWFIAQIVLLLCIGFAAIKYAINGEGLKDSIAKMGMAFIIFTILMYGYPKIVKGISSIVYEWSNISTYENSGIKDMFRDRQNDVEFWIAKIDETAPEHSEVIQVIYDKGGRPQDLLINIFDDKHQFISPNAVIRVIMLVAEGILNKANKYSIFNNFDKMLLMLLAAIAVILCGILGSLQYFICALEFTLITSVGVIMLPFMMWDGGKFITEKFIGAIVGFFIKMLFCTITMLITFYGYLALMTRTFDGTINEVVYVVFISLFYMMLCQSGPQLAVTLLTGTPQMSLMEAAKAVGAYAATGAAGIAAGKFAAQKAAQGAVSGGGGLAQAAGAAGAVKALGGSKGEQAQAAGKSVGASVATGAKSLAHGLGRSLMGSGESAGGKGGRKYQGPNAGGTNRYSQLAQYRQPNAEGQSKTIKEHLAAQYQQGENRGLDQMVKKEENPKPKS